MTETGREPTYTLSQARQLLAEQECATHGHSWDVVEDMTGPIALVCITCGRSHVVAARSQT